MSECPTKSDKELAFDLLNLLEDKWGVCYDLMETLEVDKSLHDFLWEWWTNRQISL